MWLGNGYIVPMRPKPLSSGAPPVGDFILMEGVGFVLMEDNSKIILE